MKLNLIDQKGQILLIVMIILFIVTLSFSILFGNLSFFVRTSIRGFQDEQALNLTEAGIERALYELRQNNDYGNDQLPKFFALGQTENNIEIKILNDRNPLANTEKTIQSRACIPKIEVPCKKERKISLAVRQTGQNPTYNFEWPAFSFDGDDGDTNTQDGIIMKTDTQTRILHPSNQDAAFSNANIYCDSDVNTSNITGKAYTVGTVISTPSTTGCSSSTNKEEGVISRPLSPFISSSGNSPGSYQYWKDLAATGVLSGTTVWDTVNVEYGPLVVDGDLTIGFPAPSCSGSNPVIKLKGPIYVKGNLNIYEGAVSPANSIAPYGTVIYVEKNIEIYNRCTSHGVFKPTIDEKILIIPQRNESQDPNDPGDDDPIIYKVKVGKSTSGFDWPRVGYIISDDHEIELSGPLTGSNFTTAVAVTGKKITLNRNSEISPNSNQLGDIRFFGCNLGSPGCPPYWVPILKTYKILN